MKINKILPILLIVLLGFLVYGNSIKGNFIWDDNHLVKENTFIKSWKNIPRIFTKNIGEGGLGRYRFYRPIQTLTFMTDYALWKLDVKGYHISNIIFHILTAVCVYCLIRLIFKNSVLSLLTGLFFLIHPIQTEAVSYISGRADSIVSLFLLLCFIFYIKDCNAENIKIYTLAILCYALALLSKEIGLIFPAILLLYHYTFNKKVNLKRFLPILCLSGIYILLRFTALRHFLSEPQAPPPLFSRLPGFLVALTNYLRLLILPYDLHMEYGKRLFNIRDPKAIFGLVILFSFLALAFLKRRSDKLIFFSICWFFIMLIPSTNIFPLNAYMAEHWLYLPSIGFFLILVKFLLMLYGKKQTKPLFISIALLLVAGYSTLTIRQNGYWMEPLNFFERTLKYVPDSPVVNNNLGIIYDRDGHYEKAIALFEKAIACDPKPMYAYYYNLGNAYAAIRKYEDAVTNYRKAIEITPNFPYSYVEIGNIYLALGKYEEAVAPYKKAMEILPDYALSYNNLAIVYYKLGNYESAIELADKALKLGLDVEPGFLEALKPYREITQ